MKPPRIFARGKFFYAGHYLAGRPNEIERTTRIPLDITPPSSFIDNPNWWKSSKHRVRLQSILKDIEFAREAGARGYTVEEERYSPTIESLMEALNDEANLARALKHGPLAPNTLRRRKHSLHQMRAFDPDVTLDSIDAAWLNGFREFMQERGDTEWTVVTVFSDLKMLLRFAVEKGFLDKSPAKTVQLGRPELDVQHTPFAIEKLLFTELWHKQRAVFYILITERLTGFRNSDVLSMQADAFDMEERIIWTRNIKKRRREAFPFSIACKYALQSLPSLDRSTWPNGVAPLAFHDIQYFTVRKHLNAVCKALGIERIGSHQFKRNHAHEVENGEMLPHIFNLLLHHIVKGMTKTGATHYTGRNIELMRKTIDKVQAPWEEFLRELCVQPGHSRDN